MRDYFNKFNEYSVHRTYWAFEFGWRINDSVKVTAENKKQAIEIARTIPFDLIERLKKSNLNEDVIKEGIVDITEFDVSLLDDEGHICR